MHIKLFSKLFHKDVFFPKGVNEAVISFEKHFGGYVLSEHLKEHLYCDSTDRSHNYIDTILKECLEKIKSDVIYPFEVELSNEFKVFKDNKWHVTKYCVRIPYNNTMDLVVAIRPYFDMTTLKYNHNKNKVVTAWLNAKEDNHYTLDSSKYCSELEWNKLFKR